MGDNWKTRQVNIIIIGVVAKYHENSTFPVMRISVEIENHNTAKN